MALMFLISEPWAAIAGGSMVVAAAGLLATKGWELHTEVRTSNAQNGRTSLQPGNSQSGRARFLKRLVSGRLAQARLLIVGGTLFMALGGLWATQGWEARANTAQRDGMIRAVVSELLVDMHILQDPNFTEQNEKTLLNPVVYPRMPMAAIDAAFASGLFAADDDRVLLTRLLDVRVRLIRFNSTLAYVENIMIFLKPDQRLTIRKAIGSNLGDLNTAIAKLAHLLMSNYGIKLEDRFPVALRD